tara:strand:- start:231 stop:1034 length:804 start_codon:yes stop_codon:yes gene_type:complete
MTIYQTYNSNLPNYELPQDNEADKPGITERDVDKQVVYTDINGHSFYDYDIKSKPTAFGPASIIPTQVDSGIPQYSRETDIDGEDVYSVDQLIVGNSSASLGEFIDVVNNGRVNDINVRNEKFISDDADVTIHKDNKLTSIKGILEESSLNNNFFSDVNIDAIQKMIRYNVYKSTDNIISNQPDHILYIVMRSILLQYGNFRVETENIIKELHKLNKKVVDYCSENISSNVLQYINYVNELENLPIPMDRPVYHNKQNFTYDISNLL